MRRSALVWATVIAIALLIAHAYGYGFAVANQTTYFLHALQHAHPELFRHDWLVSNTNEYHSLFGFFAGLGFELNDSGAIVFAVMHVVLMVALLCGVYLLVRGLTTRAAISIFILVTGWLFVNGEHSIAGSYLWSGYLQPSLIGAIGWLIALAMHVRGRPLATGVALAIGGLFHVNFLIRDRSIRYRRARGGRRPSREAARAAPRPATRRARDGSGDPRPREEHRPRPIVVGARPISRTATLQAVVDRANVAEPRPLDGTGDRCCPDRTRFGDRPAVRRLVWRTVMTCVICTLGTLVIMMHGLLPLTRLYIWRLAPFAVMAHRS